MANVKGIKNYIPATINVRESIPVKYFGMNFLKRGFKGRWTHRL